MKQKVMRYFFLALFFSCCFYVKATEHIWNGISGAYEFPNDNLSGSGSISYTFTSKNGTEFLFSSTSYTSGSQYVAIYLDGTQVSSWSSSYYKTFTDNASHTVTVSLKGTPASMYGNTYLNVKKVVVKHPRENQATSRNISLEEAGDLEFYLSKSDKYYINDLTLSGPINGKDMTIIKDMLNNSVGVLSVLNISGVQMVAGGGSCGTHYYEWSGSYGDYDDPTNTYTDSDVINDGLFYHSKNLVSIILPNSVSEIRYRAFMGCENLQTVKVGNTTTKIGNQAFSGCIGLTTINIPKSVTSIEECAFSRCNSLTTVITPDIASWCMIDFYDKYANPVYYAHSLYTSSSYAPQNLTIPSGCKQVKKYAFAGNTNINSVTFPAGMESIGREAFSGCSNLTSITANGGLGSVGVKAFEGCTKISSVNTKNITEWCQSSFNFENEGYSVKDGYGNYAYEYAEDDEDYSYYWITAYKIDDSSSPTSFSKSLKVNGNTISEIAIPEGVTKIGSAAFYNCNNIRIVHIPASLTSIGYAAFEGCNLNRCEISNLSAWSIISFSNYTCDRYYCTLTVDNAHSGYYIPSYSNRVLTSSNPTSVSHNLYYNGELLTNACFEESTTTISGQPFQYCLNQITSLVLPESVSSIGSLSFSGCSNLTAVKVDIATPLSISSSTFSNRNNITLYVPAGSGSSYSEASYWQDFNIVEFIEGDVNSDGEMDVVDVVDIARYVVGTPAETFVEILADINRDGSVNIGDAVTLVNEIAGDQNFVKAKRAPSRTAESEDVLSLIQTDEGLALVLANQRDYTAFQFDLFVPEGIDVARMLLNAERKQKHQLLYNKVEEGHYRVAALSTSNRTFQGNDGELLSIALNSDNDGEIAIRNIHFFDTKGVDYMFNKILYEGATTGIAVTPSTTPMDGTFYTIDGRRIGKKPATKGLYIVNGKKVVIK